MFKLTYTKKGTLFLLLFFMVFSPHVAILNFNIKTAYVFVLLPAITGFYWYYSKKVSSSNLLIILLFMELSLLYHLSVYFVHGLVDISWVVRILYGFIEFFAALAMGVLYVRYYGSGAFSKMLYHLFLLGVIHSILMIILFLDYGFREIFYRIIVLSDLAHSSTFREDGFSRFSGLMNTGFGSLSVVNASLFLSGTVAYVFFGTIRLRLFTLGSLAIIISTILSGRIGLVLSIIILFTIMLSPSNSEDVRKRKRKFLIVLIPLFLLLFSFLELYYPSVANFAFETFYNYRDFGVLDRSTDLILNEEVISGDRNVINLLFGDGNYQVPFDMGYRVMFLGGGYIGFLVSFMFLFPWFIMHRNGNFRILHFGRIYFLFFISFLIINFKNVYFFGYNDIFQVFFLVVCTAILSLKLNLNNN